MGDGRREQFEAIFAAHFDAVLRFLLARAEPEIAKDAAAETFLETWRNLDRLLPQPRGWLLVVARHKIADHYRKIGRWDEFVGRLGNQPLPTTPDHADAIADLDRVRRAFARLRPDDRELLRLIAWDDLTHAEAAEVLDCSRALFAVRLHRARRRLRGELDDREPTADPAIHTTVAGPLLAAKEIR